MTTGMPQRYRCHYPSDFGDEMDAFSSMEPGGTWMDAEEVLAYLASLSAELAMEKDYASTMREKHDDLEEKYHALKLKSSTVEERHRVEMAEKDGQINSLSVLVDNQKCAIDLLVADRAKGVERWKKERRQDY